MKLKLMVGSILVLMGHTSYACEEVKKQTAPITTDKKPGIAISGEFLKTLSIHEKINLFKILSKSDIQIDTSDWEDIDIDVFEQRAVYPPATIPTVN